MIQVDNDNIEVFSEDRRVRAGMLRDLGARRVEAGSLRDLGVGHDSS